MPFWLTTGWKWKRAKGDINTYVTLCGWSAKQTIPLSVLVRNQTKGLESISPTRPEVGKKADPRETGTVGKRTPEKGVGKRNPENAVGEGWHREESTTESRRDQSGEIDSRGSEVDREDEFAVLSRQRSAVRKTIRDGLAFLGACKSFAKTSRQRLFTDAQGIQCHWTTLFALWGDPSPYGSFVLLSFSSTPSVVILVALKYCGQPRQKPQDDSLAKTELFQRSW